MLAPSWVIVGTKLVTSVPKGTVTAMSVPEKVPVATGEMKSNAVMSLVLLGATDTVTKYTLVVESAAVTV